MTMVNDTVQIVWKSRRLFFTHSDTIKPRKIWRWSIYCPTIVGQSEELSGRHSSFFCYNISMAFPLKVKYRFAYQFGQPTFYNDFHIGVDLIIPVGTKIFAPEDGTLTNSTGKQGGLTATLRSEKYTHRFLHLSKHVSGGKVKAGDLIAYSGNTGLSTGPHTHWDVSKGKLQLTNKSNFIDPMSISWDNDDMTKEQKYYDKWQDEIEARHKVEEALDSVNEALIRSRLSEKKYYDEWQKTIENFHEARDNYLNCMQGNNGKLKAIWDILRG